LQQRGQERQTYRDRDEKEVVDRGERELDPRQVNVHRRRPPVRKAVPASAGPSRSWCLPGSPGASPRCRYCRRRWTRFTQKTDQVHLKDKQNNETAPVDQVHQAGGPGSPKRGDAPRPCGGHGGPMTESYDVIIIGTGAGGGTLAHTLAPSGKRILLLER